jgi:hypothetical protein
MLRAETMEDIPPELLADLDGKSVPVPTGFGRPSPAPDEPPADVQLGEALVELGEAMEVLAEALESRAGGAVTDGV